MDSLYNRPAATKCCNSRCQAPFVLGLHRLVGCGLLARLNKYKIWELKREQNGYSRMENGIRGNGQEKRKIISGRVKQNTEPVGTGFSRPVFTPSFVSFRSSSGTHGLGPPCGPACPLSWWVQQCPYGSHVLLQWRLHGCIVRASRFMATLSVAVAPLGVSLFPRRKICRQDLPLPAIYPPPVVYCD